MSGWRVMVSIGDLGSARSGNQSKCIAEWTVGPSGLRWLHTLVSDGRAVQRYFDGYPNRFILNFGTLAAFSLESGLLDERPSSLCDRNSVEIWVGSVRIDAGQWGHVEDAAVVTLDAWDMT